ncbi:MAG: type III-A CRISPR-associated RAMP protein Csm4 [Desulfobacteraceae bacterium]
MNYSACLLRFKSGLHLGERETWREGTGVIVHSDTLFSAFCHGYRLLYGQPALVQLLESFLKGDPPFLLSSAFPFWDETFYLPIPRCQIPGSKKEKKIAYVGLKGWLRLIRGETLESLLADSKSKVELLPREGYPLNPWTVVDVPRVGLNRLTAHPDEAFFYFGEVWYHEGAGLYFLFKVNDEQQESRFHAVWRLLAHEGLGGDRTVGKGHFKPPEFQSITLAGAENAEYLVSLSLYYPCPSEIDGLADGFYELVDRRGYIFSPNGQSLRRKQVRFFAEGSVFPILPARQGMIINVKPQAFKAHEVYRCGLVFGIPCRLPRGVQ